MATTAKYSCRKCLMEFPSLEILENHRKFFCETKTSSDSIKKGIDGMHHKQNAERFSPYQPKKVETRKKTVNIVSRDYGFDKVPVNDVPKKESVQSKGRLSTLEKELKDNIMMLERERELLRTKEVELTVGLKRKQQEAEERVSRLKKTVTISKVPTRVSSVQSSHRPSPSASRKSNRPRSILEVEDLDRAPSKLSESRLGLKSNAGISQTSYDFQDDSVIDSISFSETMQTVREFEEERELERVTFERKEKRRQRERDREIEEHGRVDPKKEAARLREQKEDKMKAQLREKERQLELLKSRSEMKASPDSPEKKVFDSASVWKRLHNVTVAANELKNSKNEAQGRASVHRIIHAMRGESSNLGVLRGKSAKSALMEELDQLKAQYREQTRQGLPEDANLVSAMMQLEMDIHDAAEREEQENVLSPDPQRQSPVSPGSQQPPADPRLPEMLGQIQSQLDKSMKLMSEQDEENRRIQSELEALLMKKNASAARRDKGDAVVPQREETELDRMLSELPEGSDEAQYIKELQYEHAVVMAKMKFDVELLKGEAEMAKLAREVSKVKSEAEREVEHKQWVDRQKRDLLSTRLHKTISPQGFVQVDGEGGGGAFDPSAGFSIFFDFVVGLPKRSQHATLAYGFYSEEVAHSSILTLPLAECEKEDSNHNRVRFDLHRNFKNVPPISTVKAVIEAQFVLQMPEKPGELPKTQSAGWTIVELFNDQEQLNAGWFKLPLVRPPVRPEATAADLQKEARQAGFELYIRVVHARDLKKHTDITVNPIKNRSKYAWGVSYAASGKTLAVTYSTEGGSAASAITAGTTHRSDSSSDRSTNRSSSYDSETESTRSDVSESDGGSRTHLDARDLHTELKPSISVAAQEKAVRGAYAPEPEPDTPGPKEAAAAGFGIIVDRLENPPDPDEEEKKKKEKEKKRKEKEKEKAKEKSKGKGKSKKKDKKEEEEQEEEEEEEDEEEEEEETEPRNLAYSVAAAIYEGPAVCKSKEGEQNLVFTSEFIGGNPIIWGAKFEIDKKTYTANRDTRVVLVVSERDMDHPEAKDKAIGWTAIMVADTDKPKLVEGRRTLMLKNMPISLAGTATEPAYYSSKEKPKLRVELYSLAKGSQLKRDLSGDKDLETNRDLPKKSTRFVYKHAFNPVPLPDIVKNDFFGTTDGFSIEVDGCRFLPDNVTFSKISIRVTNKAKNYNVPVAEAVAEAESDQYNPSYKLAQVFVPKEMPEEAAAKKGKKKTEVQMILPRESSDPPEEVHVRGPLDPTMIINIRIITICKFTKEIAVVGSARMNAFVEGDTLDMPEPGTQEFRLNKGGFQLPLFMVGDTEHYVSLNEPDSGPRIPCASVLLRIKPLSAGAKFEEEPAPDYLDGQYCTGYYKIVKGEPQLFEMRLKRSPIPISDSLKELPEIQEEYNEVKDEQDLKEFMTEELRLPSGQNIKMIDYSYSFPYDENAGFKIAIDSANHIKTSEPVKAIFSVMPPGFLYTTDVNNFENCFFTRNHSWDAGLRTPQWLDGYWEIKKQPADPDLHAIIELVEMKMNKKAKRREPVPFAFAILPLFTETGHLLTGGYQLPLYLGNLTELRKKFLEEPDCVAVIEKNLTVPKKSPTFVKRLDPMAVYVRVLDSSRIAGEYEEHLLPTSNHRTCRIDKSYLPVKNQNYLVPNKGSKPLNKLIPKGQNSDFVEYQLNEAFEAVYGWPVEGGEEEEEESSPA